MPQPVSATDRQTDALRRAIVLCRHGVVGRAQRYRDPPLGHADRLRRIGHEVDEDLMEQARIAEDER